MLRRLVAFFLTVVCVPVGFLYAGWPRLALAFGLAIPLALPTVLAGYGIGAVPVDAVLPAALALIALPWLTPFVAAALPPRTGHPAQRLAVYVLVVPAYYAFAIAAVVAVRRLVAEPYHIPAAAMAPALLPGDFVLVRKSGLGGPVAPGAVVVFAHPSKPGTDYVQRVIAVGGQTVEVRDGAAIVDGVAVPRADRGTPPEVLDADCRSFGERRAWEETLGGHVYTTYTNPDFARQTIDYGPAEVPAGHLFVLGDNRDDAADSRIWGFVPAENVKGVVGGRWVSLDPCDGMWRGDRVGPVP